MTMAGNQPKHRKLDTEVYRAAGMTMNQAWTHPCVEAEARALWTAYRHGRMSLEELREVCGTPRRTLAAFAGLERADPELFRRVQGMARFRRAVRDRIDLAAARVRTTP